jgi:hypothetical protein
MAVHFDVNEDIYKKFMLAVQLSNENENEVIERLLTEYASSAFARAAKSLGVRKEAAQSEYIDNIDFGKAIRKIPTFYDTCLFLAGFKYRRGNGCPGRAQVYGN